jgi:hypothetical protein
MVFAVHDPPVAVVLAVNEVCCEFVSVLYEETVMLVPFNA